MCDHNHKMFREKPIKRERCLCEHWRATKVSDWIDAKAHNPSTFTLKLVRMCICQSLDEISITVGQLNKYTHSAFASVMRIPCYRGGLAFIQNIIFFACARKVHECTRCVRVYMEAHLCNTCIYVAEVK